MLDLVISLQIMTCGAILFTLLYQCSNPRNFQGSQGDDIIISKCNGKNNKNVSKRNQYGKLKSRNTYGKRNNISFNGYRNVTHRNN